MSENVPASNVSEGLRKALARAIEGGYADDSIDLALFFGDPVYRAVVYEARRSRALDAHPSPDGPRLTDRLATIPFDDSGDDLTAVLSAVDHLLRDHDCDQKGYESVMGAQRRLRSSVPASNVSEGLDGRHDWRGSTAEYWKQRALDAEAALAHAAPKRLDALREPLASLLHSPAYRRMSLMADWYAEADFLIGGLRAALSQPDATKA